MSLNIIALRQDTPGCNDIVHFNNAGAALSPQPVVSAIKKHIDLETTMGGYEAAAHVDPLIEQFYDSAAKLINCTRDEIAFMDNATRAWDMIFYSFNFKKGDKILTCMSEYASNYLAFLQVSKRTGVIIDVISDDEYGQISLTDLATKIDERVKLIAVTHVPTQGGLINPVAQVGQIAKKYNIPYLLDTTQSVGQMPVDVQAIGCDFLCATGRKFLRGPRGTGFLYIRKNLIEQIEPPFIDLHSACWVADNDYVMRKDARRFEVWEQNIATKIGLKVAIDYALLLGLPEIWQRIQLLATQMRQQLTEITSIKLQDSGQQQCGIITFTSTKKTVEEIQQHLKKNRINVSISLQEYARLDLSKRNIAALVRASVHYYNTEEEIEKFIQAIKFYCN